MAWQLYSTTQFNSLPAGADPGFWEGGSEHRGGSLKQGSGGRSPPEAIGFFLFYSTEIMPKCKI